MRSFLALAACVLLQACVAAGPYVTRDDVFDRVQPGMTREQVLALTGPPQNTMPFPLSGNSSWGWFYWDRFGYYVEFSVTFAPNGLALSKNYRRVNDGGDYGK
jgi:outer membrane protein assembly factor BamE (lipoprotein component of BamABCDE complex)